MEKKISAYAIDEKKYLHEVHGWPWLLAEIATYSNDTLNNVYQEPLYYILSLSADMQAKAQYNQLK